MAAVTRSAMARLCGAASAAARPVLDACEREAAKGAQRGLVAGDATWATTTELASRTYYTAMKTYVGTVGTPRRTRKGRRRAQGRPRAHTKGKMRLWRLARPQRSTRRARAVRRPPRRTCGQNAREGRQKSRGCAAPRRAGGPKAQPKVKSLP